MEELLADNKQYIVYSCPEMYWLQEELKNKKPKWFIPGKVDWNYHPDESPNFFIHDIENVKRRHVLFLGSQVDNRSKYEELAVIYVLTRSKIKSLTVSLPFVNTATMERVCQEGEVATADVDAWLYSSLPRVGPPVEIIVYDLHTLQNRFYFHDGAILTMATGVNLLKNRLKTLGDKKIAVVFPDDGSQKRFTSAFNDYEQIVCKKVRDGDVRKVTVSHGDPKGYHVVIVDDLVQTGGTLLECRTALLEAGAIKVSAYVTHAIFPRDSWKRFIGKMEKFFITNSHPTAQKIKDVEPFEVLSLTDDLIGYLLDDVNA